MAYCFMRVDKVKSYREFGVRYEHNYRIKEVPNADKERTFLNKEIVALPHDQTYLDVFKQKMVESGHLPRKNAVMGLEILMSYDPKDVSDDFDTELWQQQSMKWVKDTFGADNVISAVLHRDENVNNKLSTHLHVMVIPMYQGKLNCKHYLSNAGTMHTLQSKYAEAIKDTGLVRGKEGSVAQHEALSVFHTALQKTYGENLPEVQRGESAEDYRERANQYFKGSNVKHFAEQKKLERKIDELKTDVRMTGYDVKVGIKQDAEKIKKEKEKQERISKGIQEKEELVKKYEDELKHQTEQKKQDSKDAERYRFIKQALSEYPDFMLSEDIKNNIGTIADWYKNVEKQEQKKEMEKEYEQQLENNDKSL